MRSNPSTDAALNLRAEPVKVADERPGNALGGCSFIVRGARFALAVGALAALVDCSASVPPPSTSTTSSGSGTTSGTAASCNIQGIAVAAGLPEAGDGCHTCNPSISLTDWSPLMDGTPCAVHGGTYCQGGGCIAACEIGGRLFSEGTGLPGNDCQTCQSAANPTSLSSLPDGTRCSVGGGNVCLAGACVAGCLIGGNLVDAGTVDATGCTACQPGVSTSALTALPDGTICDAGGTVCSGGSCHPGCYVAGQLQPPHSLEGGDQDGCCDPGRSALAWTPGFRALPLVQLSSASCLVSADLDRDGLADLVVGTSRENFGGLVQVMYGRADDGFHGNTVGANQGDVVSVATGAFPGEPLDDIFWITDGGRVHAVGQDHMGSFYPIQLFSSGSALYSDDRRSGHTVVLFSDPVPVPPSGFISPSDLAFYLYDAGPAVGAGTPWQQVESYSDSFGTIGNSCFPGNMVFGSFTRSGAVEGAASCGGAPVLFALDSSPNWVTTQYAGAPDLVEVSYAAADLNGDGLSELAGASSDLITLVFNPAGFGPGPQPAVTLSLPGANLTGLQFGAFQGDGGQQLLVSDSAGSVLDLIGLTNPSTPSTATLVRQGSYPTSQPPAALVVGDFNGDGRSDVAVLEDGGIEIFQRQCP